MSAGSYGSIKSCFTRNQDNTVYEQVVQGARFFDLDTDHRSGSLGGAQGGKYSAF